MCILTEEEKLIKEERIRKQIRDILHPFDSYIREAVFFTGTGLLPPTAAMVASPSWKMENSDLCFLVKEIDVKVTNTDTITQQGDLGIAFKIAGAQIGTDFGKTVEESKGLKAPFNIKPNIFIPPNVDFVLLYDNEHATESVDIAYYVHMIPMAKEVMEFYDKSEIIRRLVEMGI